MDISTSSMTSTTSSMTTLLIANRGEIALRVLRSARKLGLRTVAIHTDLDRSAPHVRAADLAVPVSSYLDIEAVVAAAKQAGADAIHPGYGFLSERSAFAAAVEAAGLKLVGPSATVMDKMGRKDAAREIAVAAGVPVVPSYAPLGGLDRLVTSVVEEGARPPSGLDHRDGLPGPGQGRSGRRWQGHADRPVRRGVRRRGGFRSTRGTERVRRRHDPDREVRRARPPYRGPDPRRLPWQRRPSLRARLLHPAAAPEGAGGGPRAHHHRGDPQGHHRLVGRVGS